MNTPDIISHGLAEVVNRIEVPRMPTPDRPTAVTADYYRAGGAALNVAIPLAVWGLRPAVIGNILGEDAYADLIWRELERHSRIHTRWLRRFDHVRTPFSRIFAMPDRERYIVHYWREEVQWQEVGPEMLAGVQYLSVDAESGMAAVQAAQQARDLGVGVMATDVVDPDHPLLPLSDIMLTSVTFLRRVMTEIRPVELAAQLQHAGAGRVIITNGSKPVLVCDPDGAQYQFPSFPLPPVDRTGAGDVFKAACLCGMVRGWDLEHYVRFGAAAAAVWIAQPSPLKRTPTPAEIDALLNERAPRLLAMAPRLDDAQRACPLCQRAVAASIFDWHWQMEPDVIEAMRQNYPGWRRADGACPRCIHEHQALAQRQQRPGVPLLLEGHPIYGKPDLFVLPTPVRLRANPHYTGRGITLCFLDSGFYPHPDLNQPEERILDMVDATTDEIRTDADFREPRGVSWHGLMTSVAAAGNGALSHGRYAGIARDAQVVLVKISDPRGRVRERDIARGLRWVLHNHHRYGIQIVNLSVGGDRSGLHRNSVVDGLVHELAQDGLVIVAAAGNAGQSDLYPPASAPEAITVGGIDDQNVLDFSRRRMYGSNWGRMPTGALKPEVVAPSMWLAAPVLPGTQIAEQNLILDRLWRAKDEELPTLLASTLEVLRLPRGLLRQHPAEQRAAIRSKMVSNKFVTPYYQHVDGTSFSAPIVTSVAAQMLEANPELQPDHLKRLIIATAQPLEHEPEERQGHGVITPGRAVAAALRERYGALDEAPLSPFVGDGRVHFLCYDPRATNVCVIGDFNDWDPTAAAMHSDRAGRWHVALPLPAPGRYHYKYLIDAGRSVDDPENGEKEPDGFGGFNSVLVI